MQYKPKKLSNVEIALLEIIAEKKEISGYQINKIIGERGFREWAEIGQTSIYIGLEKLKQKGLVSSEFDASKKGKGPLPKIFKLTKQGGGKLRAEILHLLSATRERDRAFDLGIAGIPYCDNKDINIAIKKRIKFLLSEKERINEKFEKRGGKELPFQTQLIFDHIFYLIQDELKFLDKLIDNLAAKK